MLTNTMRYGEPDAGYEGLKWALRLEPRRWIMFTSYRTPDSSWTDPIALDMNGPQLKKELANANEVYRVKRRIIHGHRD